MSERKLAHIEKIMDLQPIPGYDRVEYATVLDWKVVVRKGEFQIGDYCCYFEIDSKLPEAEWSEFLRPKHFKIKAQKMCKVISQGLVLPLEAFSEKRTIIEPGENGEPKETIIYILPKWAVNVKEGDDVTKILGIEYSVTEDNIRKTQRINSNTKYNKMAARYPNIFKKPIIQKIMKYKLGQKIMFLIFDKVNYNIRVF